MTWNVGMAGVPEEGQGSLTAFGMTMLLGLARCADQANAVIAGGAAPALERREGA